jgi:hypothetical protein
VVLEDMWDKQAEFREQSIARYLRPLCVAGHLRKRLAS